MGSFVVVNRRPGGHEGMFFNPAWSAWNVAPFGVSAIPRLPHTHQASAWTELHSPRGENKSTGKATAERAPHATVGDRCPGAVVLLKHRLRASSQEVWMALSSSPRIKAEATIITSLETLSLDEALAYLEASDGNELSAAFSLASDRNVLDGSEKDPDEAEVHHALFLLRRARGLTAPSFDLMRVQLRELVAA